jgi:proteasome lid subunit RPN8/RPN11
MVEIDRLRKDGIYLSAWQIEMMLAWVQRWLPEEACGLLAGECRTVRRVIPVENSLHSSTRYSMDAKAQLEAFLAMEQDGQEMVGIFHSHPNGPPDPSPSDIAEFYYPGTVTVICAPGNAGWSLRGFWIDAGTATEVPLITINILESPAVS